ncbi:hypothetical protein BGX38DRAFT_606477 [Terfezia claveryi]|nr:hypothetical protein BGX38DRAFT_606477 [Terfezia claveryi]
MKFLTLTLLAATFSLTTATPTPDSKTEVGKATVVGVTPAVGDVFTQQFCGMAGSIAWYCNDPMYPYCCWSVSPPVCCPQPGFRGCSNISGMICYY